MKVFIDRLKAPPRHVSLGARLLLSLKAPYATWFFAFIGMGIAVFLFPMGLKSLPELTHWNYKPAGQGEVVDVVKTKMSVNEQPVHKIIFTKPDGDQGICYTTRSSYQVGDQVDLEQCGNLTRIPKTTVSPMGWMGFFIMVLFGSIFPLIGLGLLLADYVHGRKMVRLLQDGEAAKAVLVDRKAASYSSSGKQAEHLKFMFTASDGQDYEVTETTLGTDELTDDAEEAILYDPLDPKSMILLDSLPEGIRYDEMERGFSASVFRPVGKILCLAVLGAEMIALYYAVSIGGFIPM